MKLDKGVYDEETKTFYFNIIGISQHDLRAIYLLLKSEKQRAKTVRGFNRGSEKVLKMLEAVPIIAKG